MIRTFVLGQTAIKLLSEELKLKLKMNILKAEVVNNRRDYKEQLQNFWAIFK